MIWERLACVGGRAALRSPARIIASWKNAAGYGAVCTTFTMRVPRPVERRAK
jgi:hypothetical protein